MIKKFAWDAFKNTGDINTYLEFCQIKNMEENFKKIDETNKGEWNNNCRKQFK